MAEKILSWSQAALKHEAQQQAERETQERQHSNPEPERSHSPSTSLAGDTRLVQDASLVSDADYALRGASLAGDTSLVSDKGLSDATVDLWASIPEVKGHTKVPHQVVDHLFKLLDVYEQAVYTQLYRLSWGWGKSACFISLPHLAQRANIGQSAAHRAVKGLVAKGLVVKKTMIFGKGKEQGTEYSLPLRASLVQDARLARDTSPARDAHIKEKDLKETNKRGGASRDIQNCPDCHGTGFWYPEGTEKGVAKCKHERLA